MPQNAQPLLQVSDLTKSYEGKRGAQQQHHALSGGDFVCGEGELVTVIGPSGAGKSTFLRCINRLIEPTEGSVVFNGQDITHLRRNKLRGVRTQIAMIFQKLQPGVSSYRHPKRAARAPWLQGRCGRIVGPLQ